jgi:hypothetical protein
MALLAVKIARSGDALVALNASDTSRVNVIWPHGFTAVLLNGSAEILSPQGTVVGREGDVLDNLGGGPDASGQFVICSIGASRY